MVEPGDSAGAAAATWTPITVAAVKMITVTPRNIQRTKTADGSAEARFGTRLRRLVRMATSGTDIFGELLVFEPPNGQELAPTPAGFSPKFPYWQPIPNDIESQH
jgi:hypothetical protein